MTALICIDTYYLFHFLWKVLFYWNGFYENLCFFFFIRLIETLGIFRAEPLEGCRKCSAPAVFTFWKQSSLFYWKVKKKKIYPNNDKWRYDGFIFVDFSVSMGKETRLIPYYLTSLLGLSRNDFSIAMVIIVAFGIITESPHCHTISTFYSNAIYIY